MRLKKIGKRIVSELKRSVEITHSEKVEKDILENEAILEDW